MANKDALDKNVQREMDAMAVIYSALRKLDAAAQRWVLRCVMNRLGLEPAAPTEHEDSRDHRDVVPQQDPVPAATPPPEPVAADGISPIASKWMVRNGFTAANLSSLYSLGQDELDLVAKSVPGSSKKDRMKNVFMLQGVASYLSTGVARMSYDKVKEACVHYDAFDSANFAKHLKDFSREVGGSKDAGFQLTAPGVAAATELIKGLVSGSSENAAGGSARKKSRK